jgi:hypothetical protein
MHHNLDEVAGWVSGVTTGTLSSPSSSGEPSVALFPYLEADFLERAFGYLVWEKE